MAAQDHHDPNVPDVDADAALRAAFKKMRGQDPEPPDQDAYAFVRSKCPALSSFDKYTRADHVLSFGDLQHMHEVIRQDDIAALRELIRIEPPLLTYEIPGDFLCPLMVLAAKLGRNDMLDILLKHQVTLPPQMRVPPENEDYSERGNWGTPLTAACAKGRLDTVRLLQGMPDTDINEFGPNGYTPFLAAAEGEGSTTEARIELIRFLLERGADIHAVQQVPLASDETLEKEYDESFEGDPRHFRPHPGGYGNALALAMKFRSTAPAVLALLVEAGVNVYQSRVGNLAPIDKTDGQDAGRYDLFDYDRAYFSPIAIGAMHHNLAGDKTLLDLFPNDHHGLLATTDATLVPEPRAPLRDPDDGIPVLLPLHAAVMGADNDSRLWTIDNAEAAVDMVRLITADEAIRAATINTPYRRHYTPLHIATGFDRIPLLLALVNLGADIEAPRRDGHGLILALFASVSYISRKSLIFAPGWAVEVDAATDMPAVLAKLLDRYSPRGKDADVDAQNEVTRLALVNEADANGNTPLHFTMAYRMAQSTAALVALGARTDVANHAGQVPYTPPHSEVQTF